MTRIGWLAAAGFAVFLMAAPALFPRAPKLIWNASASVPIGFYLVNPAGHLRIGELVVVRPPTAIADFLAERGYLAIGVPLVKRILALAGQTVCRTRRTITIDGSTMGRVLDGDHLGRSLPVWRGCQVLATDEVFLMNWQSEYSFDSRYFGPLPASTIVGRADPLWIQKDN